MLLPKKLTPFEVYRFYVNLKLHFDKSSPYDIIKYDNKSKVTEIHFNKRTDRKFFIKLSSIKSGPEIFSRFLTNLSFDSNIWISDLINSKECIKRDSEWHRYSEAKQYYFEQDLIKLKDSNSKNIFTYGENDYPEIMTMLFSNNIHRQTFIYLDHILKFTNSWSELNPIWENKKYKLKQLKPFVKFTTDFDANQVKKILKSVFQG